MVTANLHMASGGSGHLGNALQHTPKDQGANMSSLFLDLQSQMPSYHTLRAIQSADPFV